MVRTGHLLMIYAVVASSACVSSTTPLGPGVAWRLPRMQRAMRDAPDADRGRVRVTRFRIDAPDGAWTDEVVSGAALFAERRMRSDGAHYAFGEDSRGPWLRVGDGPTREATGAWLREERTQRALMGLRFLAPRRGDAAELVTAVDDAWEYAFQAEGGQTLTFDVQGNDLPGAFDRFDDFGRLVVCEDVRWLRDAVTSVLARARCRTSPGSYEYVSRPFSLRLLQTDAWPDLDALPWAIAPVAREPASRIDHAVEVHPASELQITLEVVANGDHVSLVLDSGATYTVLDGTTARRLGVVPTGEAPFYMEPPWLPAGETWVGLLDRVEVAGLPIDGMRVLVMEHLGVTGLLGLDFFRRVVVDADMPHGVVRITPPDRYAMPSDAFVTGLAGGASVDVPGEVSRVGTGCFTIDTGAMIDVIVYGSAMAGIHPRAPGSEISLGNTHYDTDRSPDYASEVDGLRFAGLQFPQMPALGRDVDRRRVGSGLALVGMGLLRHARVLFDLRQRRLGIVPGDGYVALEAFGVTVDHRVGETFISRVVRGSAADLANVREGDRIVRVNGVAVADARGARAALARASQRPARVALLRDTEFTVGLEPAHGVRLAAR